MIGTNRTILITGSTDGVGRLVATRLAAGGAMVLIHGRDRVRADAVLSEIAAAGGRARFYPADLSSMSEVHSLARAIVDEHRQLDCLINSAGIGAGRSADARETSRDGFELRFAVNYLAGFLLTHVLLPLLSASPAARIVNVASAGQQAIDFSNVMLERGYSGTRAYCQSKLAQISFTFDLAERLAGSGVTVNCLHPASYMATTMVRLADIAPASTVEEGAAAILNLVSSQALEGRTGLYFDGLRPSRAHAQAYDPKARARLRALSFTLAGLPEPTGYASNPA